MTADASPGLFSCGLPAGSSLAGFSVSVSFFSWVELRRPRRPGEIRSAGEGSAPDKEVKVYWLILSFCLPFFPSFFLKPYSQQIWYPGGRSLMFAREILPLSPSSNSTITLPSFSSSPGPPKAQHTGWRTWVAGNVPVYAYRVRLSVRLAHLDGRIQGKDSANVRSSRHTLASLQSGWPQSGAARLTPGKIMKFSV